jgi:hypothetical protein
VDRLDFADKQHDHIALAVGDKLLSHKVVMKASVESTHSDSSLVWRKHEIFCQKSQRKS